MSPAILAALAGVIGAAIGALLCGVLARMAKMRRVQVRLEQNRGDVEEPKISDAELQHQLSIAQLKKLALEKEELHLEIKNLRAQKRWLNILIALAPVLSIVIAVSALVWGIIQFQKQQRLLASQIAQAQQHDQADLMLKTKSLIRDDLDEIIKSPTNKSVPVSRGEFLLGDLDKLIETEGVTSYVPAKEIQSERRKISEILYDAIYLDSDFDDQRDVQFSIMALESWEDYGRLLNSEPDRVDDLLATKYLDKIIALRGKPPQKYITSVKYDRQTFAYDWVEPLNPAEDARFRQFEDLVRGYEKYLHLLDADWKRKSELIMRFQAATCNRDLTQARFGWSVDSKDKRYSDWFAECR